MGKASSPAAPDYKAAAQATAEGNLQSAQQATVANRPDMYTPYGSSTWTNNQTLNQPAYDAAMSNYQQALQKYNSNGSNSSNGSYVTQSDGGDGGSSRQVWQPGTGSGTAPIAPDQSQFMNGDNWSNTVTLSPSQQALFNQQNALQTGLFGAQNDALGRVNSTMSQGFSGTALDPNSLNYGSVLNTNGLPQSGTALQNSQMYDPTGSTNTATQAILSRVNPELDRQKQSLETQLANQGVTQGSQAWNTAMDQFGRNRNDAVTQAGLQGINLGMQQSGLSAGQQNQQYSQQNALRQLAAQLQSQQYNQQSNNNSQYIGAQNQGFQQQAYTRALPLNELNALRTGNQISLPTFQNFQPQATTGGPDYSAAAQNQYRTDLSNVNAQNAQSGQVMSGLFSLGSTMLGAPSTSVFGKLLG